MPVAIKRSLAAWILLLTCSGCSQEKSRYDRGHSEPLFVDRAAETGLDFVHDNGGTGHLYFPEIMGSGGAFFDFDNDGDLDVFLVQGHRLGDGDSRHPDTPLDRLFRNDLTAGAGESHLQFSDVTESSGIEGSGYGMGVTAGDVDNDGWVDLYVTHLGANRLWRNLGEGRDGIVRFEDVTESSGTGDEGWGASASFGDFNRDGWLDLYVVNYVDYAVNLDVRCLSLTGKPDFCSPNSYLPAGDRLYLNRGLDESGRVSFEDVTRESGVSSQRSNGLGVVTADFDSNGWIDLYVTNDQEPNILWLNLGAAEGRVRFRNEALIAGSALNSAGMAEASMGVSAADIDNDGDEDLFMTHLKGETNTLFLNDGNALFEDRTSQSRLASTSVAATGFGTLLSDVDLDGSLDVLVVNGAVTIVEELALVGDPYPFHQPNHLYLSRGAGVFEEVGSRAGEVFLLSEVSRGAAVGDVDNDGDPDFLIVNNSGPVRLLVNESSPGPHWLGLRLVTPLEALEKDGTSFRTRDALGALAEVSLSDGSTQWRRVRTDSSYLSSSSPRLLFGLGEVAGPVDVTVRWPSGSKETWRDLDVDQHLTLREGKGERIEAKQEVSE